MPPMRVKWFISPVMAGTIVVKTHQYLSLVDGRALRYPVGVGRAGMQWAGEAYMDGKYIRPAWSPPDMIKRENPAFQM
jgi:lipoprotein-anchoring transpeptidase ErfK/SrfK